MTRLAPRGSVALPGRSWQGTAGYRWYYRTDKTDGHDGHDGQGATRTV